MDRRLIGVILTLSAAMAGMFIGLAIVTDDIVMWIWGVAFALVSFGLVPKM